MPASTPSSSTAANCRPAASSAEKTAWASPVPTLAAEDAVRRIGGHHAAASDADRDELALASLLAGYGIDAAWYGLHHVCSQTVVRLAGVGHGPANAALLPHTIAVLRERRPEVLAHLDDVAGVALEELAGRLAAAAGATRLRELGVEEDLLDDLADAAQGRPELDLIGPKASREELRAILESAW